MMKTTPNNGDSGKPARIGRREVLAAGAGMAVAPILPGIAAGAEPAPNAAPGKGPVTARAYGATKADAPLAAMNIERRAVGPNDVLLDILYCGICHSDIHAARSEWGPETYACVPGHEIIGRVIAVGDKVTKFKVGDIGGVGCMVNSCRTCENCAADREQNCLKGPTFTYGAPDAISGVTPTAGFRTRSWSSSISSSASRRAPASRPPPRCSAPGSPPSPRCGGAGHSDEQRRSGVTISIECRVATVRRK